MLVNEVIDHFNDYQDEYVAFCVILMSCIDGLDACFAGWSYRQPRTTGHGVESLLLWLTSRAVSCTGHIRWL